ncbi:purine and uridine phosphorylase [Aspergillus udagawae]|uniref:Purine and uridine phosphorylase n=1 Tax=Aspergillus udagawae TaxID=91492 RepID=A0A8H3P6S4_9EURO|nr:purine and uridine phosphorylase [Aspergillus udagawae]
MAGNGKCKAMTTTLHLKLSYPQIQLALVVGVCGGVPYGNDGRDTFLGDVLVSDRLVQWDTGTLLPSACVHNDGPQYIQGRPCHRMETFLAIGKTPDERRQLESSSATSTSMTTTSPTSTGTSTPYGQCGGTGYTGPTECPSGWKCTYQNAYYSQCLQ